MVQMSEDYLKKVFQEILEESQKKKPNYLLEELKNTKIYYRFQKPYLDPDRYRFHINDFLVYNDSEFVDFCYRAILGREPSYFEKKPYLESLRSGKKEKIWILLSIYDSPERKNKDIIIEGLNSKAKFKILYSIPYLGYALRLLRALFAHLPKLLRIVEYVETKQREDLIDFIEDKSSNERALKDKIVSLLDTIYKEIDSLKEEISSLKKLNSALFANLQTQQTSSELHQTNLGSSKMNSDSKKVFQTDFFETIEGKNFYTNLENHFRGTQSEISKRLEVYIPFLETLPKEIQKEKFVDLACGRGEWVSLLAKLGFETIGVDSNLLSSSETKTENLEILHADVFAFLKSQPNESFGMVSCFHLIEHLSFPDFYTLLKEIFRVLKKDGIVILETPNLENINVLHTFHYDPTHKTQLPPKLLEFTIKEVGFSEISSLHLNPHQKEKLENLGSIPENLHSVLQSFYGALDFGIVAKK